MRQLRSHRCDALRFKGCILHRRGGVLYCSVEHRAGWARTTLGWSRPRIPSMRTSLAEIAPRSSDWARDISASGDRPIPIAIDRGMSAQTARSSARDRPRSDREQALSDLGSACSMAFNFSPGPYLKRRCTSRALNAIRLANCAMSSSETVATSSRKTQCTPSVHGGVVSDPT